MSYRVIADHIRCLTFALTDGAVPDQARGAATSCGGFCGGRCATAGNTSTCTSRSCYKLVPAVVDVARRSLPAAQAETRSRSIEIIREEEESFGRTLDRGIALFEQAADYATRKGHHNEIRGEDAFKLHDTYGFPIDLTRDHGRTSRDCGWISASMSA